MKSENQLDFVLVLNFIDFVLVLISFVFILDIHIFFISNSISGVNIRVD